MATPTANHNYRTTGQSLRAARMETFASEMCATVTHETDSEGFTWCVRTTLRNGAKVAIYHDQPAVAHLADGALDDLSEAALLTQRCNLQRAEAFASAVNDITSR